MSDCDCQENEPEPGWLISGYRQDGDRWKCPNCRRVYIHNCNEAEGCEWVLVDK